MTARLYTRPVFWWSCVATFAVLAGLALLFAVSGASLAFAECDGTYRLSSDIPRCRWPALWALLFNVALGAGLICGLIATWHHWRIAKGRRGSEKAHT